MISYLDLGAVRLHETSTRSVIKVEGLTGPTGVRGDARPRPEDDGAVEPRTQYLGARLVVVEGEVWGATQDAAWAEWRQLAAAFYASLRADSTLAWRDGQAGPDLQAAVRLAGEVTPVIEGGTPVISYQVQLRAADPRRYSQAVQSVSVSPPTVSGGMPLPITFPIPFGSGAAGGTATATNGGTVETWPTITVQGPIIGPVVGNTTRGEYLYFDGLSLAAGQTLVIETRQDARAATVDGANALGALRWAASRFPALSRGLNQMQLYGAGGYGVGTQMTVAWRDAYL
mgnify:CR=1 FL=1